MFDMWELQQKNDSLIYIYIYIYNKSLGDCLSQNCFYGELNE